MSARFVVRDRGGRGPNRFRVVDTATGEVVRASTTRGGAENMAEALNKRAAAGGRAA